MKKLVITMGIILISILGYSQVTVTNVQELRVATKSTTTTPNISVGTKVYCIADTTYWVAVKAVAAGWKLTDIGSFTQLNPSSALLQSIIDNAAAIAAEETRATAAEGNNTSAIIANDADISAIQIDIADDADSIAANAAAIATNNAEINSAISAIESDIADDADSIAANLASIQANDTELAAIQIDIANDADSIAANATAIAGITSNIPTSLETGTVNETTYGITSDGGTDDIVLAAATTSAAGVMTATQVTTLNALELLSTQSETLNTSGATPSDAMVLSKTVKDAAAIHVSINGAILALGSGYTYANNTVTFTAPIFQYDEVVVTYTTDGTSYTAP